MSSNQREEALDHIAKLLRQGTSLDMAKQRALTSNKCGLGTN